MTLPTSEIEAPCFSKNAGVASSLAPFNASSVTLNQQYLPIADVGPAPIPDINDTLFTRWDSQNRLVPYLSHNVSYSVAGGDGKPLIGFGPLSIAPWIRTSCSSR